MIKPGILLLVLFIAKGITCHAQSDSVLVCKGASSYAYHADYCRGLKKCNAVIIKIPLNQAVKMGRTPCGFCYKSNGLLNNLDRERSFSYEKPAATKR